MRLWSQPRAITRLAQAASFAQSARPLGRGVPGEVAVASRRARQKGGEPFDRLRIGRRAVALVAMELRRRSRPCQPGSTAFMRCSMVARSSPP